MRSPHRTLLAESLTPDGEALTLTLEAGHHVVRVRGELLMSSRVSGSEEALARLALDAYGNTPSLRVLVGGLGMGFTLRALLDALAADARVEVVELLAPVVAWNRGVLASHAGDALKDPRVQVIVGDVVAHLAERTPRYDAIVLDIDNGPEAFTVRANDRLYAAPGLRALYEVLRPGGTLVLWSAFRSPAFERRLRAAGFTVECIPVRARGAVGKGARHTVFRARSSV